MDILQPDGFESFSTPCCSSAGRWNSVGQLTADGVCRNMVGGRQLASKLERGFERGNKSCVHKYQAKLDLCV